MSITQAEAKTLLKATGLRVTAPRVAVLITIATAQYPLSHSEVLARLGTTDWDPATIYRNLVKLRDSGLISVVARANGIDRYALVERHHDAHGHPHFVCDDCGQVSCLPDDLAPPSTRDGRWAASVRKASVQLRGECPDCLEEGDEAQL